jgi:hypothetical protein
MEHFVHRILIWYGMIWFYMIYDMTWYDVIWYDMTRYDLRYGMIYLTAVGLTPGSSRAVHIYTQTVQQYSTHLHTNSTVVHYTFTHKQYNNTVHIYTQTVQ